jgi:hypothetical protein
MSNHDCYEKFKDLIAMAECLGATVGMPQCQAATELHAIATNHLMPTKEECN